MNIENTILVRNLSKNRSLGQHGRKTGLRETGGGSVNCIELTQDNIKLQPLS
jgi:hypothetical protein